MTGLLRRSKIVTALVVASVVAAPIVLVGQAGGQAGGQSVIVKRGGAVTYRILEFEFATGDDDLRSDSTLQAEIRLGRYRVECFIHGPRAAGNDTQVTWDNGSTHMGAPCALSVRFTAHDIQTHSTIILHVTGLGSIEPFHTWDNWDINKITVYAHNEGSKDRVKMFCTVGHPLARITADSGPLTVTDLLNNC